MDYSFSDIICIHYYYPPIRSGGVIRNYYFSKAFSKQFRHVHIITTSNVDVLDQEPMEIAENITIYKATTKDFRSVKRGGNHISMNAKNSLIYKILAKLKKTLPFHFYIDEGGMSYINNAEKIAVEIIENNPITTLYSSFMPYADHKIANRLKQLYPLLLWIADFRDLQQEPIYKNIYFPRWNTRQERKLLAPANLVTTISQGLVNSMEGLHNRIISIPRGVDLADYESEKDEVFRLTYTGSLFYNYRDGLFFVRAFAQSINRMNWNPKSVRFEYAGRESKQWKRWFKDCGIEAFFEDKGFVSRSEAQSMQRQANILVLLTSSTNEHQGVFTGKLFEYLETRNPIINVLNGTKDKEFELLFDQLQAGRIFYPSDSNKLVEYICSTYENFSNGEINGLSDRAIKNRNSITWDARVKEMLNEV